MGEGSGSADSLEGILYSDAGAAVTAVGEVERHRHARDQNHYSCYCPVEMVLHPKLLLACMSFSWHPTTYSGGGEMGGRKEEKGWEGPAVHRDTAEVRLAGT